MKVMETPASVPSSAARGVILRMMRRDEAAGHQHEALDEDPGQSPASHPSIGSPVFVAMGSMMTNVTMNMCGTLMPEGSAQTSVRPVFFASRYARQRVIRGAEAHHQPRRGQDAAGTPGRRAFSGRSAGAPSASSRLTRMFVPKPKNAFQSPGDPEFWFDVPVAGVDFTAVSLMAVLPSSSRQRLQHPARVGHPPEDAALSLDHSQPDLVELREVRADSSLPARDT